MSKAFYVGLGIVVAAPFLFQGGMSGFLIHSFSGVDVDNQVSGDTSFMGVENIENTGADEWEKPGYTYIRNWDEIDVGRKIEFGIPVDFKDLLKPGETQPKEDLKSIFVKARTKELGREECEFILKFLAKECVVKHVRVFKPRGEKKGREIYNVNYQLAFVQKNDFGRLNTNAQVTYEEIQFDLEKKLQSRAYTTKQVKKVRKNMLREVVRRCEKLRDLQGNCAITGFRMQMPLSIGDRNDVYLRAAATLSYLQGGPLEKLAQK